MYRVCKIDVASRQPRTYEYEFTYSTWQELVADLAERNEFANAIFMGRGAHIYRNDDLIGHTDTFNAIDKPIQQATLTEFRQSHENGEP